MTTAENLNRIIQAKADIKTAIENKGVAVGDLTIDSYAEKINQIEQGESGKIVLPDGICLSGSTFTELDMAQWDWSNVHSWEGMFDSCRYLTTLSNIPQNITVYGSMTILFRDCEKLASIDLTNWDTSNVTNMSHMFSSCRELLEIRMGGDVSKVTDIVNMFSGVNTTGTFYYNPQYDYSKIIDVLPYNWTAIPME